MPMLTDERIAVLAPDDLATLGAQEDRLTFVSFTNDDAIGLGMHAIGLARRDGLAVTVAVQRGDQQLFHMALDGTNADNDSWVQRKVRVVRRFEMSSLRMGAGLRLSGTTMSEARLLDEREYAAHGGAFPIRVANVGVVGVVTVSGLPQRHDHALVVTAIAEFLGVTL